MTAPTWSTPDGRVQLYLGDCLEVLRTLAPGSVDAVVTDPPYGVGKAEWDVSYPRGFVNLAFETAPSVCIMPGLWALPVCVADFGAHYKSVLAGFNANALTHGPIGFNNWIPAVVGGEVPRRGQDACRFVISGKMPNHPCPKPLAFMFWLVGRVTEPGAIVADPYMGSGTTGVACIRTGRRFIGCEIDEHYFEIAQRRIEAELDSMALLDGARKPAQADLNLEDET